MFRESRLGLQLPRTGFESETLAIGVADLRPASSPAFQVAKNIFLTVRFSSGPGSMCPGTC